MAWNNGWGPNPLIDTPANLTTAIGATIPSLPSGNPTAMAVKWQTAMSPGNTPFFCTKNSIASPGTFLKMYFCFEICLPTTFNNTGNNIKWVFFAGATGVDAGRSHVFMLTSGNAGGPYRGPWLALQGGGAIAGSQNVGGTNNTTTGLVVNLSTPTVTNDGLMHIVEGLAVMESTPGTTTDGVFKGWVDGTLVLHANNLKYNATGDSTGFNEYHVEPYYGGGGSAPATNYFGVMGHTFCAGGN